MRAFHLNPSSVTTASLVLASVILLSFAACSPKINVATRFNSDVNYKDYASFSFPPQELSLRPSWVDGQIKMDVERIFKSKGYAMVDPSDSDLVVAFQTQRNESYPLRLGRRRRKRTPSITFEEGSLTLEIRDSFNQQVYRGVARDVVAPNKQETRKRLRAAVETLLDDFPEKE